VQEFSSFVKPRRSEKLHDMINMITGISRDQLESAPDWKEIHEKVATFFDEKTVII
jgi:inhibitor of KinA sporulation pathway (predicted exonuclease)